MIRTCLSLILFCVFFIACVPSNNDKPSGSSKYQQYYVQGGILYTNYCSNCHQVDGSGLGRLYPPLNKSDFLTNHFPDVVCLIKNGKRGELVVNGVMYNQPMKGNPALTDLEVAEIVTYIYNTWSNQKGLIEVAQITSLLNACAERK